MPNERLAREIDYKSFTIEVKDESRGEVVAVVATLNAVDRDGDVFLPGSIPTSKVKLSGYGHDIIFDGAPPAGTGTISEEGDKAILRGRFFLTTTRGSDAFHTVKEMGADGEWSVGFPRMSVKTAPMTDEWRARGAKRLIASAPMIECSPVFQGAQFGTGTLLAKEASAEDPPPPDPAIEAARIEAERVAQALEQINKASALRFSAPPAGVR
jgi:hypothetical protein